MASIELKEVPASAWAAVGWLGPQVAVIDEQFRIGFWDGTKYALGGGGGGGGGEAVWGDITGTLSAQADLQAVLDAKVASSAKASQSDAEGGSDNNSWMTPLRTAQAIDAQVLAPAWGEITGTLSVQADLQAALNAKVATASLASQATAEAGSDNATWMSPLRVAQALAAQHAHDAWGQITGTLSDQADLQTALAARVATTDKASQAEAEAGTENAKWMTPLRTKQSIAALVNNGFRGYGTIAARNALSPAPVEGDIYVTSNAVNCDVFWRYSATYGWEPLNGSATAYRNRTVLGHTAGGWAAQNVEVILPGTDIVIPAGMIGANGQQFTIELHMHKAGSGSVEAAEWRLRMGSNADGTQNTEVEMFTLDHNSGAGTQTRKWAQKFSFVRDSATQISWLSHGGRPNQGSSPYGSANTSYSIACPPITVPNLDSAGMRISNTIKQITDSTTDEWWVVTRLQLLLE